MQRRMCGHVLTMSQYALRVNFIIARAARLSGEGGAGEMNDTPEITTPIGYLYQIWLSEPLRDLPTPPPGYDVREAERLEWLVHGDDGWRVGPHVAPLFGWCRD